MPSANDCWGIEVGANAVKAIHLKRDGDDISVADFEVIPHKHVLTAPDTDMNETIRVALDQFIAKYEVKKSTVIVSVPGHMAFARFAKLPPVEPKQIPDIVKYEAVQQIPFPIEQVEWDYQVFADPDSPDVEVGIFAMTKERVGPWLENFKQAGIPTHGVMLSPIAVFNALNYDHKLKDLPDGTVLMDIGTQSTELIITERDDVWLRTIPIGGNQFTEALVHSFKLSHSKAEKLKREATSSKYARQIFQAMRPVFVDLVQEVQKSLGYYQSLHRGAELGRLIGLGSTFRLPGLQTFLKQQLQIDVRRLDQFKQIDVTGKQASSFADQALTLAPAYGLALQGLGLESVSCNLLPKDMIRKQMWRAKQPWFAGAAAAALLGVGVAFGATVKSMANDENNPKTAYAKQVMTRAAEQANKLESIKTENPADLAKNMINMFEYNNVSACIVRDIDEAAHAINPQPPIVDGDYPGINQIEPDQRNQVLIDEVVITYESGLGQTSSPSADSEGGSAAEWDAYRPTYAVQLTGSTPNTNAENLLHQHFMKYLKDNADRENRPYVITDVKLNRLRKIPKIAKAGDAEAATEAAFQAPQLNIGSIDEFDDFSDWGDGGGAMAGADAGDYRKYLPKNQLISEGWAFTITWKVALRPPGAKPGDPMPPLPGQEGESTDDSSGDDYGG